MSHVVTLSWKMRWMRIWTYNDNGAGNPRHKFVVIIMADGFVKWGRSEKEKLTEELHKLEAEIEALGTAVSDSQIWHKKSRIEWIKKRIAELELPAGKFNAGTDKLNDMMAAQQPQLTPEQIAELHGGRG